MNPDVQAEMCVIGVMLMAPEKTVHVFGRLIARMFADADLGKIFAMMKALYSENKSIDTVTVLSRCGPEYKVLVTRCAEEAPSVNHFDDYVALVLEHWRVRELDRVMADVQFNAATSAEKMKALKECIAYQERVEAGISDPETADFAACMDEFIAEMHKPACGVPWPYKQLQSWTGGLMEGGAYVIAGRPGMGKTAFALRCASAQAVKVPVLYITLEMSRTEVTQRIMSRVCGIPSDRFRDRKFTENDLKRLELAREAYKELRMHIDQSTDVGLDAVEAKIIRYKPRIVYIDHIGLMRAPGKRQKNEELAEITRGLKLLAKKTGVSIVELCQLNRAAESGKISMGTMFGSDTIAQDADGMFAFTSAEPDADVCRVALHVLKYRNGSTGTMEFDWTKATHEYVPVTKEET